MPPVKWDARVWRRALEKGARNEGRFAKKRFALPQLSSFARLCPPSFCVPGLRSRRSLSRHSAALGAGGGWGLPGLIHHGYWGWLWERTRIGAAGVHAPRRARLCRSRFPRRASMGQGTSQLRQQSPLGCYGAGQRNYGHWPSHGQPSQVGTREFPGRGHCGGGPCPPTHSPWRGQGHPSKVGTTESRRDGGRREEAVMGYPMFPTDKSGQRTTFFGWQLKTPTDARRQATVTVTHVLRPQKNPLRAAA